MPVTSKELREKRAPIGKRITELADKVNDEKRDFQGEEIANWKEANDEYNRLTRQIELAERSEQVARDSTDPSGDPNVGRDQRDGKRQRENERRQETSETLPRAEDRGLALQAWFRAGSGKGLKKQHREACRRMRFDPNRRAFNLKLRSGYAPALREARASMKEAESRALSAVAGPSGGDTVPDGFMPRLEVALLQYGGMNQVAEVWRTDNGVPIPWPTMNDTNNEGEMIGESKVSGDADPATGSVLFSAYKFSSKFIKVPSELFEDSAFMIANFVADAIGERLGRAKNRKATIGNGASQPTGVLTAAKLGLTAASVNAITADEILKLERAIDPAYRVPGQTGYMCHDDTMLAIRLLKDGEGHYIWQKGLEAGDPDRLNGYPVSINQHFPTLAASAKSLGFGNWKKFKVREVRTIRLKRLVERFADADQEGFIAFQRMDSNLLDAGTGPIAYLQQAAA